MEYTLVLAQDELDELVAHYLTKDGWVFDVETIGDDRGNPRTNDVVWISFACEDRVDVIPMGHPNGALLDIEYPLIKQGRVRQAKGLARLPSDYSKDIRKATRHFSDPPEQLSKATVMAALAPMFQSDAVKIGHTVKFDIGSVAKYLKEFPTGPLFDTRTIDWVVDSRLTGKLSLKDCVKRTLGVDMEKGVGARIEDHPFDVVADYSALDADLTFKLQQATQARISPEDPVWEVFDLEMDVLHVLCQMEYTGVQLDQDKLRDLDADFDTEADLAEEAVYRAAGRKFPINSVPQKQRVLFDKKRAGGQGLRPTVLTKTGQANRDAGKPSAVADWSTSQSALAAYEGKNEVVDQLLRFQKFRKLRSTYTAPYLGGMRKVTRKDETVEEYVPSGLVRGRLHATFNGDRTETGRMACSKPNLMNVPARTTEGLKIRELFVPSEGHIFAQADFSQIEPRIIADLADEREMIKSYAEGGDIYQTVADRMGVDRAAGKTLVLAIAYGTGAKNIAGVIGVSVNDAHDLMKFFNQTYSRIPRLKSVTINRARKHARPYSETILGRRRYLDGMNSSDNFLKSRAERQCFNFICQGSAADIMKLALIRVQQSLPAHARILLTIHDEIVVETPIGTEDDVIAILKRDMEAVGKPYFRVPLVVDTKIAENWAQCK